MKLAEAIMERSTLMGIVNNLHDRIERNLQIQEGEIPQEDPQILIKVKHQKSEELLRLITNIQRINASNYVLDDKDRATGETLQAALVRRDYLFRLSSAYSEYARYSVPNVRGRQSEIKVLPVLEASSLQKEADKYAKAARELDRMIQKTNWYVEYSEL